MKIANDVTELIGNTPLVRLNKVAEGSRATIVAKLESIDPCTSVKDRIGVSMINEAEKAGKIQPGKTVLIEPTSGNTGIGSGLRGRGKGYKLILTMPDTMSLGAPRAAARFRSRDHPYARPEGHEGRHRQSERVARGDAEQLHPAAVRQPGESQDSLETTGPEIWEDTDGKVDILISGIGTGGTLTGVSEYIKPKKPSFKAIAVEPTESPVLSGGQPGPAQDSGYRRGICSQHSAHRPTLTKSYRCRVTNRLRWRVVSPRRRIAGRHLFRSSRGSRAAGRPAEENAGKLIVVVLPDSANATSAAFCSSSLRNEAPLIAKLAAVNIMVSFPAMREDITAV